MKEIITIRFTFHLLFILKLLNGSNTTIRHNLWRVLREISSVDSDIIIIDNKSPLQIENDSQIIFVEKIAAFSYNDLNHKNVFENINIVVILHSLDDWNSLIRMIKQLRTNRGKPFSKIFIQWPVILENENEIDFQKLKEISLLIQIDFQLFVAYTISSKSGHANKNNSSELSVWEAYSIKDVSIMKKLEFSYTAQFKSQLASRRQDFQAASISAISPIEAGFEHIIEMSENDGVVQLVGGFTVDIYRTMRDFMNFTETVVEGNGWVSQLPSGSLGGMASQIINGEADISIPLSYLFPYRVKHLAFLQPIAVDRLYGIFRNPYDGAIREIYSEPFDIYLWLAIIATHLTIFCSIILIVQVKSKTNMEAQVEVNNFECETYWMREDSLLLSTVGIISQQGWYMSPASISSRIFFFTGMLFGLVLYSAYCAMLISGLAFDLSRIHFLSDLLKYKYTMLIDQNVSPQEFINQGFGGRSESFVKPLLRKYNNDTDALKLVLKGKHVYFKSKDSFYEQARLLNCSDKFVCDSISYVQFSEVRSKSGMFVSKTSVFKEIFNFGTILILERGINDHFKNILIQKTYTMCPKDTTKGSRVLTLQDVSTPFFGLAIGIVFSLLVLLIEIVVVHTQQKGRTHFLTI